MYKSFRRMNKKDKTKSKKRSSKTSNLTSKRLTMPPGFLSHGIVSDTAGKNIVTSDYIDDKENTYILKEDLHGLFNQFQTSCGVQNQRRSARIHKKNVDQNVNNAFSAADYNNILVENPKDMNSSSNEIQRNTLRDTSKSIFKEINRKYAGVEKANKLGCNSLAYKENNKYEISEHVNEQTISSTFSSMLKQELSVNIREDNLKLCQAAIKKKIEVINDILVGRTNPSKPIFVEVATPATGMKNSTIEMENILPGFSLIPSSQWVYETPPGRKLQTSNIPKPTNIQPAVIYKQQNHINIYELEPNTLQSNEKHMGDIQKTFIFENNFQNNNLFEDFSFNYHNNGLCNKFNFVQPSTHTKPTIHMSPPPKMAKWSSNGTVVFSESAMLHHRDMITDNSEPQSLEDMAGDMTIIEDNGNYHMTTSQNIQPSFDFRCHRFGEQPSFLFNNNQLGNGYTSYKVPLQRHL
ncbi:unnamed protein product [Callosobruchus maculatus]|uniref:Uncharacterized protein n=1 Tax=Callosobruchus maculatus TaxID=64391 RepID=A0A653DNL2_CALMS|nr:unnamed protein product [Callosobruchus maculatus]